jgi:hypothetical protein
MININNTIYIFANTLVTYYFLISHNNRKKCNYLFKDKIKIKIKNFDINIYHADISTILFCITQIILITMYGMLRHSCIIKYVVPFFECAERFCYAYGNFIYEYFATVENISDIFIQRQYKNIFEFALGIWSFICCCCSCYSVYIYRSKIKKTIHVAQYDNYLIRSIYLGISIFPNPEKLHFIPRSTDYCRFLICVLLVNNIGNIRKIINTVFRNINITIKLLILFALLLIAHNYTINNINPDSFIVNLLYYLSLELLNHIFLWKYMIQKI